MRPIDREAACKGWWTLALACGGFFAGVPVSGTAGAADPAPAGTSRTYTVTIENLQFHPQSLTVRAGDRITWINRDLFPHTVTARVRTFDSGSIAPDASWTHVARSRGRYAYVCSFHPTMAGTLIVQ
jgi:plastocyanin